LAAQMAGKGRVVACDVSQGRLRRAKERLKRAGIDNVEPRVMSSERDRWVGKQKGKFDRVLIDAPCSGTGAWRRNPDARWRSVDLAELTALQARILDSAARLVKPGGRLIYVTCSLLPEENEAQVERFLAETPGFRTIDPSPAYQDLTGQPPPGQGLGPFIQLTPASTGTDGFFIAMLERTA
jgi:16S rRNA (cytosine967-C5)-methyltransferase